jgi:hypothetical protein
MSLTTSKYIVDIIKENAEMVTLGTNPQTYANWLTGEQWERNLVDRMPIQASLFPFIYLSRPVVGSTEIKNGTKFRSYTLRLVFAGAKQKLEAKIVTLESTLRSTQVLKSQFEDRLYADSRIEEISRITDVELFNQDDCGWTGIGIDVSLLIVDDTSICLT